MTPSAVERLADQLKGAVCVQWVKCNRPWCHCVKNGTRHGPYHYFMFRQSGKHYKRYIRRKDVNKVRAICEARRRRQQERREAMQQWRELLSIVRGAEQNG